MVVSLKWCQREDKWKNCILTLEIHLSLKSVLCTWLTVRERMNHVLFFFCISKAREAHPERSQKDSLTSQSYFLQPLYHRTEAVTVSDPSFFPCFCPLAPTQ